MHFKGLFIIETILTLLWKSFWTILFIGFISNRKVKVLIEESETNSRITTTCKIELHIGWNYLVTQKKLQLGHSFQP